MTAEQPMCAISEQQNDRCFRHILENIKIPAVTLDSVGTILFCNDFLLNLTGWKRDEIMERDWFELFVPPECRIISRKSFLNKMGGNSMPTHSENEIITRRGERRLIAWDTTYFLDSDGAMTGGTSIGRDITDKRLAKLALQKSEEKYRMLVDFLPAVVFRGYLDWGIELTDNKIEDLTGYSRDEFETGSISWRDLIHEEDRRDFKASLRQAVHDRSSYVRTYRIRHKAGNIVWVHTCGQVVVDEAGRIKQICGAIFDISDQKRMEEQFYQSQKMEVIGRLAGGVAHDFNNLLTVILGYGNLIRDDADESSRLHHQIVQVVKAGETASALANQLLAYSRKQVLQPVALNLNQVLFGMEHILKLIVGCKIDLTCVQATDIGEVMADPGQLEQIIMNLVINARDAMAKGGMLTIETSMVELDECYAQCYQRRHEGVKAGSYVLLAVSDNGCGMDQETVSRIFEPFFTTKSEGKGTGLGLSSVCEIVRQNKGHIWVYSEPAVGTTFKIYLPVHQDEALTAVEVQKSKKPNEEHNRLETVLVVEDSEVVRLLACNCLREFGYNVLDARHGGEALRIATEYQGQIHLLLTDVIMPGITGRELAAQLKRTRSELKVLYMSGYAVHAIVSNAALEKEDHFLQKPFSVTSLEEKLREALAAPHANVSSCLTVH